MDEFEANLSTTEISIIRMIASGMSTKEMALETKCSLRTIEKHRSNIIKKLKLPKGGNLELWIMKQQAKQNKSDELPFLKKP